MLYIVLKGHWNDTTFLNIDAATGDKTDDVKNSFYDELECIFDKFAKHYMNKSFTRFQYRQGRHYQIDNWEQKCT
jgi:hypothetical protein